MSRDGDGNMCEIACRDLNLLCMVGGGGSRARWGRLSKHGPPFHCSCQLCFFLARSSGCVWRMSIVFSDQLGEVGQERLCVGPVIVIFCIRGVSSSSSVCAACHRDLVICAARPSHLCVRRVNVIFCMWGASS
jgi:hypothetical protein